MDAGFSDYLLTQGVLGFALTVSMVVNVYQQRKLDRKDIEHYADVKALNALLLQLAREHAEDFLELSQKTTEVLQGNSTNMQILSEKIQVGKRH